MKEKKLGLDFYLQDDVVALAQDLLGRALFTKIDGKITGGFITETEAYRGPEDRASHAYHNRKTKRTKVMFDEGGICYIYLCYGMHYMLNIVTNHQEIPHAILIRGLLATHGLSTMARRRNRHPDDPALTEGPGSVAKALGINHTFNSRSLLSDEIWIEEKKMTLPTEKLFISPRIGVDYAGEDAKLPWRFKWRP